MTPQNRRSFIQTTSAGIALSALGGCSSTVKQKRTVPISNKPNVLVILVDDLGFGDLSCYGAPDLKTPNIDQLCTSGMTFNNAYANCPVCSPTRAALLSGRYQEFVGVPGVIRTHHNNSWGHLTPDSTLLPQILQQNGYHTAIIGKWHLGLQSPNTPTERGFDFFHGFLGDMMDDYYHHRRHDINYMRLNEKTIDPKGHATDLFTDWTCDYLRDAKPNEPFFLYLAYNAPHTPIQPPKEWLDDFKKRNPNATEKRAGLAALIEHLDHGIGKVMNTLKQTGLDDNTLVIFTSDNGGFLREEANNGPYRNGKGTLYEGGIREPMCASWKGVIEPKTYTDRITLTMDIMPTVLEVAEAPIRHQIEGRSFLKTLKQIPEPPLKRDFFFGRREGGAYKGGRVEAVRHGDWKLLNPMPNKPYELYNLKNDPYETTNLAQSNPDEYNELKSILDRQLELYDRVPWQPPQT